MPYPISHSTAAATPQPASDPAEFDACLIDDEFDEFLDRQVADIRDSLAGFRHF